MEGDPIVEKCLFSSSLDDELFPELFCPQMTSSSSSSPRSYDSPLSNEAAVSINSSLVRPPELEESNLIVDLFHKPRGSKGVWLSVEWREKLRVTKGKGKRMKLEIGGLPNDLLNNVFDVGNTTVSVVCGRFSISIGTSLLYVELVCLDNCGNEKKEFSIDSDPDFVYESMKSVSGRIIIELKLFRVGFRLQFSVLTKTSAEKNYFGKSVEFSTKNNGMNSGISLINMKERISAANEITNISSVQDKQQHVTLDYNDLDNSLSNNSADKKRKLDAQHIFNAPMASGGTISSLTTYFPGSMEVNGAVRARAFVQLSDIRLKTNIREIIDAIDIVTRLKGHSYQWKQSGNTTIDVDHSVDGCSGNRVIGLIAQEVQQVLPEVVHEDPETGLLAVSYSEILPVLIEAFKEFTVNYRDSKDEVDKELLSIKENLNQLSRTLADKDKQWNEQQHSLVQEVNNLAGYLHSISNPILSVQRSSSMGDDCEGEEVVVVVEEQQQQEQQRETLTKTGISNRLTIEINDEEISSLSNIPADSIADATTKKEIPVIDPIADSSTRITTSNTSLPSSNVASSAQSPSDTQPNLAEKKFSEKYSSWKVCFHSCFFQGNYLLEHALIKIFSSSKQERLRKAIQQHRNFVKKVLFSLFLFSLLVLSIGIVLISTSAASEADNGNSSAQSVKNSAVSLKNSYSPLNTKNLFQQSLSPSSTSIDASLLSTALTNRKFSDINGFSPKPGSYEPNSAIGELTAVSTTCNYGNSGDSGSSYSTTTTTTTTTSSSSSSSTTTTRSTSSTPTSWSLSTESSSSNNQQQPQEESFTSSGMFIAGILLTVIGVLGTLSSSLALYYSFSIPPLAETTTATI